MATLSKHGQNKQIQYVSFKKAYCSDGTVMKNRGYGWKVAGKLKPGIDWLDAFNNAKSNHERKMADFPMYAHFSKLIKELCPSLSKRQYVITGLEMLGNDADGLYIELDENYDTRGYLDLDDVCELCKYYELAIAERN